MIFKLFHNPLRYILVSETREKDDKKLEMHFFKIKNELLKIEIGMKLIEKSKK